MGNDERHLRMVGRERMQKATEATAAAASGALRSGSAVASDAQEITAAWARYAEEVMRHTSEASQALLRARTFAEMLEVQAKLLRDNMQSFVDQSARIAEAAGRMRQLARQQMQDKHYVLTQVMQRLVRVHPRRRFNDWQQRLDDLQTGLVRCVRQGARQQRLAWRNLADRLSRVRPALLLKQRREVCQQAKQRLREQAQLRLGEWKNRLATLGARIRCASGNPDPTSGLT